jgi:hypothetical protein
MKQTLCNPHLLPSRAAPHGRTGAALHCRLMVAALVSDSNDLGEVYLLGAAIYGVLIFVMNYRVA